MPGHNGYASKEAKELGDYMAQASQLRAIANVGHNTLKEHIIKAINEAAASIEKLALKPNRTNKEKQ
jgi:RNA-binding protein YhbY